jgi:hypothetical protein
MKNKAIGRYWLGLLTLGLFQLGLSECPSLTTKEFFGEHPPFVLQTLANDSYLLILQKNGYEDSPSTWYQQKDGETRYLGEDLSALRQVVEVHAAANGQWLAVLSVGEGHPILEVVDLPKLQQGTYQVFKEFNPYPGSIWAEQFSADGQHLLFSATVDMKKLAGLPWEARFAEDVLFEESQLFILDLVSGAIHYQAE